MMITKLFTDFMVMSISMSLVIVVLVMVSSLLGKRYTAKLKYWIWLILAVRLLLPFNFSFSENIIELQTPEFLTVNNTTVGSTKESAMYYPVSVPMQQVLEPTIKSSSVTFSFYDVLILVWVIGILCSLLYQFTGYFHFRKKALRWSQTITNQNLKSKVVRIFEEVKVKTNIPVLVSEVAPNPMLVGIVRPVLLLPSESYKEEEFEFIIKHELIHYKRKDILYKLVLQIVRSIHWINPFVWLLVKEASREIEVCCDDAVVKEQSMLYRKKYCEAILSSIESTKTFNYALSTSFTGGKNTMKTRFISILNMRKKKKGVVPFFTVLLVIGSFSLLAACTSVNGQVNSNSLNGNIYSQSSNGEIILVQDGGNSYSIDDKGKVSVSYQEGKVKANAPLQLDISGTKQGMTEESTGFYISEKKTAIVYGFADGNSSPLKVLISNDKGKSWEEYVINDSIGYDTKFIGFTDENNGWIVSGGSAGVGKSLNYIYQTADGGKTWNEIGNANDVYTEQVTGAGFSESNIGFLSFRYYEDNGPVIYWTKDRGGAWGKLAVNLSDKYSEYERTPLSPIFNGKEGLYPILLSKKGERVGMIYLTSADSGLAWKHDESLDQLEKTTD